MVAFAYGVAEISFTSGAGDYTLSGATADSATFAAKVPDGEVVVYKATDGAQSEYAYGIFNYPRTLRRLDIISSSNNDEVIDWPSTGQRLITLMQDSHGAIVSGIALGNVIAAHNTQGTFTRTLSVSGAGAVSVGFMNNVMVLSAAAGGGVTSMGQTALGNTTGLTSSQTRAVSIETISGAGDISVGFSNGTMVISGTAAGIPAKTHSYFEPVSWGTFTSDFVSMNIGSFSLAAGNTITLDQLNLFASRRNNLNTVSAATTTAAGSSSATASGGWYNTISFVLFSQANPTQFVSFSTTTGTISSAGFYSVTRNSNSLTFSVSHRYEWAAGTSAGSTFGATFSASVATATTFVGSIGALAAHSNNMRHDIPCAMSFGPGIYLYGFIGSTSTATATGSGFLSVAAGAWSAGYCHAVATSGFRTGPGGDLVSYFAQRWGTATSAGGAAPTSIAWLSIGPPGVVGNSVFAPFVNMAAFG